MRFTSIRFQLSTLKRYVRCYLDPLSRALSNRCIFYESAGPSSVDGRPKRIEKYAFSNENILM